MSLAVQAIASCSTILPLANLTIFVCKHRYYTYKGLAMRITTDCDVQSSLQSCEFNCYVMMSESEK